eukprot:CAMPEP_0180534564 /NCGR_PEP_ID=MMETSP1036_2-20121128/64249_1 /TAXON_ID=632150 /ORGANISM="Azadinium spinosum, Strain 3D9" /LENGTH=48 /DNA_ID= /DNA_START= /DNA_END= /DNA_ORIENTATION=
MSLPSSSFTASPEASSGAGAGASLSARRLWLRFFFSRRLRLWLLRRLL